MADKKTIADFPGLGEMYPRLAREEARVEADRCINCYDAPCTKACPAHIDIPRFIKQISSNNLIGSAATIFDANALGHSCARVCPVDALCEGSCVYLDWHDKPIQIGRLQRYATDALFEKGVQPFSAGKDNGKKVAIVGAGPAGLSAAFYLRRLGFHVTMFEQKPKPGGLSTYGMAEYKMDMKTALDETELLLDLGVDIRYKSIVGENPTFESLAKDFDAVFLGVGLGATNPLGIPGEDKKGVYEALHFIEYIKNHDFAAIPAGQATVCIGAGNTAIDVVTQAKRIGTPKVVMAYRRSPEEMTAYPYEYDYAKADAVAFEWWCAPKEILGKDKVEGIRFVRTKMDGKKLVEVPGSEFDIACDRVVKAIGQQKQTGLLAKVPDLELDKQGRVLVDGVTMQTSNPKFYAGGDAINGGKEIVNASADGKRAAYGIWLNLFEDKEPGPEHAEWIQSISGRRVVRPAHDHTLKKEGAAA